MLYLANNNSHISKLKEYINIIVFILEYSFLLYGLLFIQRHNQIFIHLKIHIANIDSLIST